MTTPKRPPAARIQLTPQELNTLIIALHSYSSKEFPYKVLVKKLDRASVIMQHNAKISEQCIKYEENYGMEDPNQVS